MAQIATMMEEIKGMTVLELNELVKARKIDVDEALRLAEDKKLIQT